MADGWKLEAIKEQFRVLNSTTNLQQDLNTNDVRAVVEMVSNVVEQHLRIGNMPVQPTRSICCEIIKHHEGDVRFGFIVVVTDQKVNGQLTKIPVFIIQFGNKTVFIDMTCCSYTTWNSFMQHADKVLPNCKLCFPVDGQYKDLKRLKINFASSNQISGITRGWNLWVKWGIGLAALAGSFLFSNEWADTAIPLILPLAKKLLPFIEIKFVKFFDDLIKIVNSWRQGRKSFLDVTPQIFHLLSSLHDQFKDDLIVMAEDVKHYFRKAWNYLRDMFPTLFDSRSPPLRLLAVAATSNDDCLESMERHGEMNGLRQRHLDASQIFEGCRNESAFHQAKGKSDYHQQDLTPFSKSLIAFSANIVYCPEMRLCLVDGQQKPSQNDVADILDSIKCLVYDEYEKKFKFYSNCLEAAGVGAGHNIDVNAFNKSLGITGDPKFHFLMESVKHVQKSPVIQFVGQNKCIELKEKERVLLIQCVEIPNNKKLGLYRCIGIGKGLVPATEFVRALTKIVHLEENELVEEEIIGEGSAKIIIISGSLVIWIWQRVNEDNDAEGMVLLIERCDAILRR